MTCRVTQEALANYKVQATSGRVVVFDTATTGISRDDEIVEHGISPTEALDRFFEFLGRAAPLVAHNIHFDFRMIQNECRKFEYMADPDELSFCDTIALAKKLAPGHEHYNLSYLIEAMGLEGVNSHNALDDTLACGTLFFDLMRRIPEEGEYIYEPICE